MAAGNAVSETNGVTGEGGTETQARVFCDSNVHWRIHAFRFFSVLTPVTPLALRSRLPFLVLYFTCPNSAYVFRETRPLLPARWCYTMSVCAV